jgi:ribonuclease HII
MLHSYYSKNKIEAGCDEAGRGCLAGPVVAAAVILPKDYKNAALNDSKKLNEKHRLQCRDEIYRDALTWAVGIVDHKEIDQINILNASFLAMHRAIEQLKQVPELLLIDGNRFNPYKSLEHQCIIKGDSKYLSIAAASILAKTHRDELMQSIAQEYPAYGWERNKGYPTIEHRNSIKLHGPTPYHRMSFQLLPAQTELFS